MGEAPMYTHADQALQRRRHANVRLAAMLGGLAVFIFVMALWKLRPI